MSPENLSELRMLSARRFRIAAGLTAVMMVAYFGFVSLIAFDKALMGTLLVDGGLSIGVLSGAGVILLAPLLTGVYVRWANRHYDDAITRLKQTEKRS